MLQAIQSLYCRSQSLVHIGISKSDPFPVRVALRQGGPLLTVMDRISRHSQAAEGVGFGGLRIPSLLFADGVILFASSNSDFQLSLRRFAAKCQAAGIRISTSKSEARNRWIAHSMSGVSRYPNRRSSSIAGSCSRVRRKWSRRLTDGLEQRLQ